MKRRWQSDLYYITRSGVSQNINTRQSQLCQRWVLVPSRLEKRYVLKSSFAVFLAWEFHFHLKIAFACWLIPCEDPGLFRAAQLGRGARFPSSGRVTHFTQNFLTLATIAEINILVKNLWSAQVATQFAFCWFLWSEEWRTHVFVESRNFCSGVCLHRRFSRNAPIWLIFRSNWWKTLEKCVPFFTGHILINTWSLFWRKLVCMWTLLRKHKMTSRKWYKKELRFIYIFCRKTTVW